MTVGQRIMQKRKELGLSQEKLGEQLGVSRQAIYKWESDGALPEIEKLAALSKIFSVPVGWLLGMEEESAPREDSGELTEKQLAMVEEIVRRYEEARPAPVKRRRWPWVLLVIAICLALLIAGSEFLNRLAQVSNQYSYLQNSIDDIQSRVSLQIGTITDRVEEILKSQNDLTADYTTAVADIGPAGNTVTFSYTVRPKTYREGMTAWIDVVNGSGQERTTFGPFEAGQEVFSGEVTVALTDLTTLYIVFEHEGVRQTQLLDVYSGLYRDTFPNVWPDTWPLIFDINDSTNTLTDTLYVELTDYGVDNSDRAAVKSYRAGLFADRELVAWFQPTIREYLLNGEKTREEVLALSPEGIVLDRAKEYVIAAVVVDEYGREFILADVPAVWSGDNWTQPSQSDQGPFYIEYRDGKPYSPDGWKY